MKLVTKNIADVSRDEISRFRDQITEDIRFERLAREELQKTFSWKLDRVVASYNQDQNRLSQTLNDALRQISDKSAAAQLLSNKLQDEGSELKRLALSLQEEATVGLKLVTEKTEESIRRLQTIQERQGDSIKEIKSTVQYDVKGLKDQLVALESRLRSDFSKQIAQDHLVRDGLSSRLRDCEDVIRQTERKVWGKYTALEDKTNKSIEQFKRDVEDSRSKLLGSIGEFRVKINENKQELQSLETKVELKLNSSLNSARSINSKTMSELEEVRGSLSDFKRVTNSSLSEHAKQMEVLESVIREQFEQMQRLKDPETFRNATIVVQHAQMERRSGASDQLEEPAKDFAYLQYRVDPPSIVTEEPLSHIRFEHKFPSLSSLPESPSNSEMNPEEQAEDRDYQEIFGVKPPTLQDVHGGSRRGDESSKFEALEVDEGGGEEEDVEVGLVEHGRAGKEGEEAAGSDVDLTGEALQSFGSFEDDESGKGGGEVSQESAEAQGDFEEEQADRLSFDDAAGEKEGREETVMSLPLSEPKEEEAEEDVTSLPLSRGAQDDQGDQVQSLPVSARQDPPPRPAAANDEIPEEIPSRQNSADAPVLELGASRPS
uniref:Uncharacterized protein n=1 Tax=Guillardia theta TaxID=55529 RepID=A0A7S4ULP6_GUITH